MGKCIIMTGGMGGIDPDELTADPEDVLKGKIAGVRGSDEPIIGTLELTGTAADSQVYAGQTYYNTDAKTKRTGTMQAMSGQVITPGAAQQTISCAGKYMTGNIVVQGGRIFKNLSGSTISSNTKIAVRYSNGAQYYFYYVDVSPGFTPVEGLVLGGSQGTGTHLSNGGVHKMGGNYGGFYGNLSNNSGILFFTSNKCRFFVDEPNTTYWYMITGY